MSENIRYIDAGEFETEVLSHDGLVAVDFYSTECPPCEALAGKFDALASVYGDDVKFIKIFRQENRALAERLGVTSSPTVLFYDRGRPVGDHLTGGVKRADLKRNLDALLSADRVRELSSRFLPSETACDVLILGAGPAGLTAAIYAAQSKLRTIVVDPKMAGGNLSLTHQISNFPGFPKPQPGFMLAHYLGEHAKEAGAEFRQAVDVSKVDLSGKKVVVDELETIFAKRIIIATGSSPRELGIAGEREYRGRGISYCATCDAKYFEGKHVVVIGGGNTAVEESLFIAKFASKITVVHQFDKLQANKVAQEKAFASPKIEFVFSHEPRQFIPKENTIGEVVVEDLRTGGRRSIGCDGVFVFAGMKPNLEMFKDELELDDWGYIKTDEDMKTNIPGVYAAGDATSKKYRQMTTAVADGTIAAIAIAHDLES